MIGPQDQITFSVEAAYRNEKEHDKVDRRENVKIAAPIGQLFIEIFDSLLSEPSEFELRSIIGRVLSNLLPDLKGKKIEFSIPESEVTSLRFHFEALGLIQAIGAETQDSLGTRFFVRKYIAWVITDKGRRFVSQFRAFRRASPNTQQT